MKLIHILAFLFFTFVLGCALYAGSFLVMRFFYLVLAIHWFVHLIGIFVLAGVIVGAVMWLYKEFR